MDLTKMPALRLYDITIEAYPEKSLGKTLDLLTRDQLYGIFNSYNIEDEPVFRTKAELQKFLEELILANCCRYFFYKSDLITEIFDVFYKKRNNSTGVSEVELYKIDFPDDESKYDDKNFIEFISKSNIVLNLIENGLVFQYIDPSGRTSFVIPDEIYAEITKCKQDGTDKNFGKWQDLRYFAQILVSLYGVVTADDFMTLWNIFRPENKLTYDETLKHIKFSSMYLEDGFYNWNEKFNAIFDDSFDEDEDVSNLLEHRKKHTLFIPEKEVMEQWFDDFNNSESDYIINDLAQFEIEYNNPFYIQMSDFLRKVRKKYKDHDEVLGSLLLNIKLGLFPSKSLAILDEDFGLTESISKKDWKKLINIYMLLHNSAHHWTNYGWTPSELSRQSDRRGIDVPHFTFNEPTPEPETQTFPKVGRNDPCPCGSGKKYKHCHGK